MKTDEDQIFDFVKWILLVLYYDRVDLSKGIDPAKSNISEGCIVYPYWFLNHGFKFENLFLLIDMI